MAFYNANNDMSNFVISWNQDPIRDHGVFAKGYRLAAEHLARHLLEKPRFSDYEAYPVVFLYRTSLELYLKHIIYESAHLAAFRFRDDIELEIQKDHDLVRLFKLASGYLKALFPSDDSLDEVMKEVGEVCSDWNTLDPRSYSYRYPIDKQRRPSTSHHQVVNLGAFAEKMSSVLQALGVIGFGFDVEIERSESTFEEVGRLLETIWDEQPPDSGAESGPP